MFVKNMWQKSMDKFVNIVVFFVLTTTVASFDDIDGCVGNVCYRDASYPHDEIQDMWNHNTNSLLKTLGELHTDKQSLARSSKKDPCELCETKLNLKIQLLSVFDKNEKLYIARTEKFSPEIEINVCKDDAVCQLKNKSNDYSTNCIQKMTTINLLAYNKTSKKFVSSSVNYPSGCECMLYSS